jgi:hypothetical protein
LVTTLFGTTLGAHRSEFGHTFIKGKWWWLKDEYK